MEKNWIYHNSHDLDFRSPFGAVLCEKRVALKLELTLEAEEIIEKVFLRLWREQETKIEMQEIKGSIDKKYYYTEIAVPDYPCVVWYYFIIIKNGQTYYYGNNKSNYGGVGMEWNGEPPSYQITVYKKIEEFPYWFTESVMYQIFVDRFCNGYEDERIVNKKQNKYSYKYRSWDEEVPLYERNASTGEILGYDIYGGNLLGVIKKLSYLKELGIKVLYLNPIFNSPSNHKYDTADYMNIDPMFGDNKLFQKLCQLAKEMDILIILDGVFSHTGSDSIYFNKEGNYAVLGAYQSEKSPYYSWYSFEKERNEYLCWWGIDTLPNVNEMDPSYRNFIIKNEESVIKYWLRNGAKGWRLDVADELPDEFIKEIRKIMKQQDKESILIGEVWEDASRKESYGKLREYLLGEELDSVMNYPFRRILLDFFNEIKSAEETNNALMSLYENYPLSFFYSAMNLIGSHDVPRILTLLGDSPSADEISEDQQFRYKLSNEQKHLAVKRLKLITLIQMTFPGVPCIYYGDEAGMEGYKDPLNRGTYPWGRENQEILKWYKKIIRLRNNFKVLRTGAWFPLYAKGNVYCYLRKISGKRDIFNQNAEDKTAVIIVNRSRNENIKFTFNLRDYCGEHLWDELENKSIKLKEGILSIDLNPLEGKIFLDLGELR